MKKKTAILLLILITVVGSVISFYASNLLFSDLSNMFYGVHDIYIVSSVPLFITAVDFTVAFIFVMRFARYPEFRKATVRLYTVYLTLLSLVGIVFSVLSGTIIYHSFTAPYPFFCYPLIMLIFHSLAFAAGIVLNIYGRKKLPKDEKKKHFALKYILYSILLVFLVYFSFSKFGALLYAPFYVHMRTLYLTFPFYISLLFPLMLLVHIVIYFMDGYVGREKLAVAYVVCLFFLNVIFGGLVFIIGYLNPAFISAVSPALALERLATFPVNTIFQFAVMVIMSLYYLIYALKTYKLSKKA